jgi:hypothetical protein
MVGGSLRLLLPLKLADMTAEVSLKVALNTINQIKSLNQPIEWMWICGGVLLFVYNCIKLLGRGEVWITLPELTQPYFCAQSRTCIFIVVCLGLSELRLGSSELRLGSSEIRLGLSELRLGSSELRLGT